MKLLEERLNSMEIRITKLEKNAINKDDFDNIKKELEKLRAEYNNTVIDVKNNKEQIDIILEKLSDIENGYKQGDENLQKEIDELKKKLNDINSQLDLLLKLPRGDGQSADADALNNLMKKILELEKNFNIFVEKVNIDEIYRQLKDLYETKADKKDLDELSDKHNEDIEAINKRIDSLFSQMLSKSGGDSPVINFDSTQFVIKSDFDKYKKEIEKEFKKIWDEIENLKNLISQIFNILKTKANLSDLDDLKNFLLGKIEELALASVKKFADKNETTNNFKYLEDQIKKILDSLASLSSQKVSSEAETWLLAKKPINGYACASCENFIGDLREDSHKFIPWNKMPLRDPGDKLYRMGNGFSKMLQMLNFDNNGNMSLSPNIINNNNNEVTNNSNESNSRVNSALPNMRPNSGIPKKRIQSAKPKVRTDLKNLKKNNTVNNLNKDEFINDMNNNLNNNELYPDIYNNKNQKINENLINNNNFSNGPKITKIVRKTSNNKFGYKDNNKDNSD